jgi:hypothetical protein
VVEGKIHKALGTKNGIEVVAETGGAVLHLSLYSSRGQVTNEFRVRTGDLIQWISDAVRESSDELHVPIG